MNKIYLNRNFYFAFFKLFSKKIVKSSTQLTKQTNQMLNIESLVEQTVKNDYKEYLNIIKVNKVQLIFQHRNQKK